MNRHYLISNTQVRLIRRELEQIKRNCISTPDIEASYDQIQNTLANLEGA